MLLGIFGWIKRYVNSDIYGRRKGPLGIDMGNTTVDVTGVRIPLIALDDLIETKRTGRLQDAADIEALEEIRRFHRKSHAED